MNGKGQAKTAIGVLLVSLSWAMVTSSATAERSEPILIRQTPLLSPPVMIGLGVVPELRMSLEIDERGSVTAVETLSIEPSTEYDDLLSTDVADQLGHWRFAPAREDGIPVATRLELMVQVRESTGSVDDLSSSERELIFFGEPEERTSRLLRLPPEERKKIVDRYALEAEKNLAQSRKRRAESARFLVLSDAENEDVARVLANNLEAAYNTFEQVFADSIELQPEKYKIVAFLFSSRESFHATQKALRNTTIADGFYAAPGVLAFHQEAPSDRILAVMIHEAFHAFADRKLRNPSREELRWFEEGMAEYFGNSQVKKGQIVPGKTITRQFVMHYGRVLKATTQAGFTLPILKRAIRQGEAPALGELLSMARQEFYGDQIQLNYGTSWMLIHFLRHGRDEWISDQFPRLALYLYEGYDPETVIEQVYGLTVDQLQPMFDEYARTF